MVANIDHKISYRTKELQLSPTKKAQIRRISCKHLYGSQQLTQSINILCPYDTKITYHEPTITNADF